MKLAEALIMRADLQTKFEQLKKRLNQNASVQEGEKPSEDPKKLIAGLEKISAELESLIRRINRTNTATEMEDGVSIADALAARDVLKMKHRAYADFAVSATITRDRYSASEIKFKSTVKVSEIQATVDRLAKEHRELDAKVQEKNWATELFE